MLKKELTLLFVINCEMIKTNDDDSTSSENSSIESSTTFSLIFYSFNYDILYFIINPIFDNKN